MNRWTRGMLVAVATGAVGIGLMSPTLAQDKDRKKMKANLSFEVYRDAGESFRWRLKSANSQIIATSGAGYKNKSDCMHGIDLVKAGAAKAEVKEVTESEKEK